MTWNARAPMLACFVGAGLLASARSQPPLRQVPADEVAFVVRHWHSSNGLPQNTVNAYAQTSDGQLWIATLGGLCSFDGERMRVFDPVVAPALHSSRFACLCVAHDNTLWIGSDQSGLASLRHGEFRAHPEVAATGIKTLAEDADRRLWVGAEDALWRQDGSTFRIVAGLDIGRVQTLLRARDGSMLVGTTKALWRGQGDRLDKLADGGVDCLVEHGSRLLVGTQNGLYCWSGDALAPWQPDPWLREPIVSLLATADGALWVGGRGQLLRVAAGKLPDRDRIDPAAGQGPPVAVRAAQAARTLFVDREGGVWVGHTERGAVRYRPADVAAYGPDSGLPSRGLAAVAADGRGGLLVTTAAGLFERAGNRFVPVAALRELGAMRTLTVDDDGTQWIVTLAGLVRRDAEGWQLWCTPDTWPCNRVNAIVRSASGEYWLGGSGLALLRGRELVVPPLAESFRGKNVRALALGRDGALWVGCSDRLVRCDVATSAMRTWRCGHELPVGEVRSILPEAGLHAWIATYGGGIVRIDEDRCVCIDERHGLNDQHLCGMLVHAGQFVVASNRGLCLLPQAQAEAVVAGTASNLACRLLGTPGDAVVEINGGFQGCVAAANGTLWFTGIEQLMEFDPTRLPPPPVDRPARVQYALVGETRQVEPRELRLAADEHSLFLRLGTCAIEHPESTRFCWRVVGASPEWSVPSYAREVRLDLPAGAFVFEARTVGIDGVMASTGLQLPIVVAKAWWETGLGRTLLLAALLAGGAVLVRFGASWSAARSARLQALVDERTAELVAAQQLLEQRVAERTEDLRAAMRRQQDEQLERQRLERQLQQMQRMESLGQLAGGIAHDFNNLLTVVGGAGELLASEPSGTERSALCRSILHASERGRGLTQHLLAVASRQPVVASRLDLAQVAVDLRPVLQSLLGDDIALRFEIAPGGAPVRAALAQVEQILLNLAANSRDAMPSGGCFTVRVAVRGARVVLEVVDTGHGMPPEVVERAFEPFFSTKGRGPARGLGLATVYGICKQLAGSVAIQSEVGRGTSIRIDLPLDQDVESEPVVLLPTSAGDLAAAPHVGGRIVLIEDEPVVRATLERMLRRLGCAVVIAEDGADAVLRLQADPQAVDAIVSDVVMLGLHGRPLVEALRAVRDDLPIVFVSGYLDGRFTQEEIVAMGIQVLQKPLDLERLAMALRRALSTPEQEAPS